jgi:hypothetical protein
MNSRTVSLSAAVASTAACILAATGGALAGPDCIEPGGPGAGPLPPSAYVCPGLFGSPLHSITGQLSFNDNDHEDMYQIHIDDPATFSAKTTFLRGGASTFDTMLFLFDINGLPLLANDDRTVPNAGSLIMQPATDGTGQLIPGAGCYYLAISGAGNVPLSVGGPQFFFANPLEISGHDGPGGLSPIIGWSGGGPQGDYVIILTGASVCPTPGASAVLALGLGAMARRRRR